MTPTWDIATSQRLRARRRSPSARLLARPRWWLLAAVIALHVLFLLVARRALLTTMPPRVADVPALQARFVPILLTPQAPPPPPIVLPERPATRDRRTPVERPQRAPRVAEDTPPAASSISERPVSVLLPAHSASTTATPDYVQRLPQGDTRIMRHVDPVPYTPTRFEKYFPPADESAGGALVRRVGEKLIKTKDVDLPRGVHLKCKTLLGIPTFDCMMPPPPPSAKDGDERLNMAPAAPLARDPKAAPPPSVAACIALYRAGKPLVWGCPVDTPNRAVDEELRQRAAGASSSR